MSVLLILLAIWVFSPVYNFCSGEVKDLNEGVSYSFRVYAKNASGSGKATCTEHSIVVKDDFSKPVVDTKALYVGSVSAKAGEDVRVKMPVYGNVCWF